MSKMMRISDATVKNLQHLAKELGKSKQSILEKAVESYVRVQFLKKTNEEYVCLQRDPKAWKEYLQEIHEWDVTLMDGLNDD